MSSWIANAQSVNLTLQASNLKKPHMFKNCSPFAVVTRLPILGSNQPPEVIGRTETIKNCRDPKWTKTFRFDFEFSKEVYLEISIYDHDKKKLGSTRIEVGKVFAKKQRRSAAKLDTQGVLYAQIMPAFETKRFKTCHFALDIYNFAKAHKKIYYEIHRQEHYKDFSMWSPIYRSVPKYIGEDCSIHYEKCAIALHDIHVIHCSPEDDEENRDLDWDKQSKRSVQEYPLRVSIWESRTRGRHRHIGMVETSLAKLIELCKERSELPIYFDAAIEDKVELREKIGISSIHFAIDGKEDTHFEAIEQDPIHEIVVDEDSVDERDGSPRPTFVNYIAGGCELDLCVAIDFTASNGNPLQKDSPHYIDHNSLNLYEKAIISVGKIITNYDTDKLHSIWGFGAKYEGKVRHAFQVGDKVKVTGVKGILDAYRTTFHRGICMSSPVVCTEVIRLAAKKAKKEFSIAQEKGTQSYSVLMILTHGKFSDMEATKEMLKKVTDSPLSVIFVGIGDSDFSHLKYLDDFQREENGRDCCTFVKYDAAKSQAQFAEEALREIPSHLTSYFLERGIYPCLPQSNDEVAVHEEDEVVELDNNDIMVNCKISHSFDENTAHISRASVDAPAEEDD